MARRIAQLPQITCASPLICRPTARRSTSIRRPTARWGIFPASNRDYPLEFCRGGKLELRELPARLSVSGADAYIAGARAGMGLIQAARYSLAPWLEQGELVEVLAETPPPPMPIYIMYPPGRFTAPRVRVLIDWLIWLFDQQKSGDMAVFQQTPAKREITVDVPAKISRIRLRGNVTPVMFLVREGGGIGRRASFRC